MSLGLESFIMRKEKKQSIEEGKNASITEIIQVSRTVVNYRQLFPGEIAEENLEVTNCSGSEIKYKVHIICQNEELASLEEYVFSMRKTGGYDYNDKYLITQSPSVKSCYKIALKVPNFRTKEILNGRIEIFSDEVKGKISIPLSSTVLSKLKLRYVSQFLRASTCYILKASQTRPSIFS
jgi:hypothetical protein